METVYFTYHGYLVNVGMFAGKECVQVITKADKEFKDYERIFYSEDYQAQLYRSSH